MRKIPIGLLALALAFLASAPLTAQPGTGPISGGGGGGGLPGANQVTEAMLKCVNSPTDEYALTYESTTGDFEWQALPTGTIGGSLGSTDNLVCRADGTGGVTIQGSVVSIADTTGAISGAQSITGGTSGSSTLTLDGDSTVTGSLVIDGAGKSAPSGGIDLRTSQSTPLNVIFRAGSSGTGYFYLGSAAITGYDSPVVVDGGVSLQIMGAGGVLFEGTTDNSNETSLVATDPTADRTITLPNATGTVGTFVAAPAAATDACVAGQYAVATGFAYFCVSANTWERVPIATW